MPRESDIQKAIADWLQLHHWWVYRMNSGTTVIEKPTRRVLRSAPAGTPDLLAFRSTARRRGEVSLLFVEVKRPHVGRVSDKQRAMLARLEAHGARCVVVSVKARKVGASFGESRQGAVRLAWRGRVRLGLARTGLAGLG
jgi:hypothetical protein